MSDCVSLFLLKFERVEGRVEPEYVRAYMYVVYTKPEIFDETEAWRREALSTTAGGKYK